MGEFQGFPGASARSTPIPNLFFTGLLPVIDDLAELKVTLAMFWRLSWKKGYPRFVTLKELEGDSELLVGLAGDGPDRTQALKRGLGKALARHTFLALELERDGVPEYLYFLNTETDRLAIDRVQRGQVDLGALPRAVPVAQEQERRDIFSLYEQNIGLLSPLIIEELKEADEQYPQAWIVEAFREAVRLNNRRWKYVRTILERWKAEGRPHGRPERNPQEAPGAGQAAKRRGGYIVKRSS